MAKTIDIFGATAVVGMIELVIVFVIASTSSDNLMDILQWIIVGLIILPVFFYYKKQLGLKKALLSVVIGTVFMVGVFFFFKYGLG